MVVEGAAEGGGKGGEGRGTAGGRGGGGSGATLEYVGQDSPPPLPQPLGFETTPLFRNNPLVSKRLKHKDCRITTRIKHRTNTHALTRNTLQDCCEEA